MANSEMLVRIKADTDSYNAGIAKARRTLDGFKQDNLTLGGIINQSTKSIVAAAAQYASFAGVLGAVASGFAEAASKGMEMSREAEGVKAAFDRLNKPGLLDNLREATHGTVNDLELMKQAVKFDNFNLSLEQMGTFLAFAQQQAKDTGQDVNYLVDSIVTGLGRKSLPILDNLGLSAEEIKNRMKETGDMTTAVAEIIKERMEAAGGYIETAADRAAQGQARLDNAMKDLGDTMNALTVDGASLWTELKIGAIDFANNAIKPLILKLKLLGYMFNSLTSFLNGPSKDAIVTRGMTDVTDTVDDNGRLIRKSSPASIPSIQPGATPAPKKRSGGGSGRKAFNVSSIAFDANKAMLSGVKSEDTMPSVFNSLVGTPEQWSNIKDIIAGNIDDIGESMENLTKWTNNFDPYTEKMNELTKAARQQQMAFSMAGEAAYNLGAALAGMDDPAARAAGTVISAIANIALGFGQAVAQAGSMGPWAWLAYVAAGTAALATTISTVHSLTGYAEGGIVKGNSYSGDNIYGGPDAMVNAGELVLSRAQQSTLASQLQNNGSTVNVVGRVVGEDIFLSADRYARRSGRGSILTGKNL
jgi:hypothetical protein